MFQHFFRHFRPQRSIRSKFNLIIGLIIVILLVGLLNFWLGIKVMSGIRAYVNGEGLWSKAQKEAVSSLVQYTATGNQIQYNHYLALLRVQAGDKQARLELNKAQPNYQIVRQGFIQGGNNPADVDDMTFLYRQFHATSFMREAIDTWAAGDAEISDLESAGTRIHQLVSARTNAATNKAAVMTRFRELYAIDARLTVLEDHFSATLGQASRRTANALIELTIITSVALGGLTIAVAILVARAIVRLDITKSEFVSLASHQLRTPLTAINWYAEALLAGSKGQLSAGQKEYMLELSLGGRRMSHLINDILKVSSLDLGTYKSEVRRVKVSDVLLTVLKDLQPGITHKQIDTVTNVDPHLPHVKLDDQLLASIFQNLISNSTKYTPDGGRITIDVAKRKQNLWIHVGDNGIGIPADQQAQIFTKLFRADNAKQLDSDGSGLGLYIVHALADRLGGRVWFTSNEGKGSDFYVTLPIYRGLHARRSS